MKKRLVLILFICVLALAGNLQAAWLVSQHGSLPMISQKINVQIKNQVAITTLEMVFYNPYSHTIQPNIKFPIGEKASIQAFSLTDSDGNVFSGSITESEQAQKTFTAAQQEGIMPALAVQKQPGIFETAIGAIGPKSRASVTIEYSEILEYQRGNIYYNLPFEISQGQREKLESISLVFDIADQKEITVVRSPSHDIYAQKTDDNSWNIAFEKLDYLPSKDFSLVYEVKAEEMATNFMSTRPDPEKDGYFMLMLSPQEIYDKEDVVAKDIVFVVDTSGSMAGYRLQQTKAAFDYFVNQLHEKDRFSVISFSSYASAWQKKLHPASTEAKTTSSSYLNQLKARGGTNINDALQRALKMFDDDSSRTKAIVFMTDGQPTVGVTEVGTIVENYNEANVQNIRTFTVGVGRSLSRNLLDRIALENRGQSVYITSNSNIEIELKDFYLSIATPLLVDLKLNFGDMEVSEVYPKELPNLYQGTQLVVTGRYKSAGESTIDLIGSLNNQQKQFSLNAEFVPESQLNKFVSSFWARAKAADLLQTISAYGETPELKQQVVELSKNYQFATPYTSFIAVSTQEVERVQPARQTAQHDNRSRNNRQQTRQVKVHREPTAKVVKAPASTVVEKRVVVRKTKAKPLSLWGASGFLPIAAIAMPNFRKARQQSRQKACEANQRVLLGAIEMYNMDHSEGIENISHDTIDILLQKKYLRSPLMQPESDCAYGNAGSLLQNGEIFCVRHGSISTPFHEMQGSGNFTHVEYDENTDSYVLKKVEIDFQQAPTSWQTRIWNNFLLPVVNIAINVPLMILGVLFSLYMFYVILLIPYRLVVGIFGFIIPRNR